MPVKRCQSGGRPGFKWGDEGECYTYAPGSKQSMERARRRAVRQGAAIGEYLREALQRQGDAIKKLSE